MLNLKNRSFLTNSATYTAGLIVSLSMLGCSSTIELTEPPMAPIESKYQTVQKWQVYQGQLDKHDTEGLSLALGQKEVFIASNNGGLAAYRLNDKSRWQDQIIWQSRFSEKLISGPVLDGEQLLVGTSKGRVKSINPKNGVVNWQTQLSSEVLASSSVSQGKVFTRTADGKVYALNRTNGEVVWVSEHQMPKLSLRGAPKLVTGESRVYVAWETGVLQALDIQSGNLMWETRVALPSGRTDLERIVDIQSTPILKDGTLYALGYHGKFVAINTETGNFEYVREFSGYRDFAVTQQMIYLVDEQDVIYALDRFTGGTLWSQKSMSGRSINDLQVYQDDLVVADAWGYIHWFNGIQGNEYARIKHSNQYGDGNRITDLKVINKQLLIVDETGAVTKYQVEKSNLLQFREQLANEAGQDIEPLNQPEADVNQK